MGMEDLLQQIEEGLKHNQYYLSLFVALTIPDICGAHGSEDGKATGQRFKNWFNKYVAPKYSGFLDGDTCYLFRCSLLHQGLTNHINSRYSRILFIEPRTTSNILHNNIMQDALNIDVNIFCQDIIASAREWLKEVKDTDQFKINFEKFVKRHPTGLAPYIKGVPVIS